MIKLEHVVLASPEQMEFIIEGMRNIDCSWEKSDSKIEPETVGDFGETYGSVFELGDNDHDLMQRLAKAGTYHRKFMRMMPVYVRITAPLYWWKEFDTYLGKDAVESSCLVLQNFPEKEFTLEDFSCEHLDIDGREVLEDTINVMNESRAHFNKNKEYLYQIIQLIPNSYTQTSNVMMNYEVLADIYKICGNFMFDEWREFRKWIEDLPYSELICCNYDIMTPNEQRIKMGLEPINEDDREFLKMRKVDTKDEYDEAFCKSLNRIAAAADVNCSDNCNMECPHVLKEN